MQLFRIYLVQFIILFDIYILNTAVSANNHIIKHKQPDIKGKHYEFIILYYFEHIGFRARV